MGVAVAVLLGAPAGHAEEAQGSSGTVNAFSGSFGTRVPISVPAFHGLEPQVGLEFASAPVNGFVGVGWNVSGASWIDRTSAGRGTPQYDSTDVFRLDGMQLVACGTGVISPSCTSGGNYATRIESYSKIYFNSSLNQWTVWTRDGTKSVYTARFTTTYGTLRWALATRSDTRGNTVTYNWFCDGISIPFPSMTFDTECYLDTITYNGVTVRFWREERTDVITFATGSTIQGRMKYRLKSIEVRVGSSLARAYQLTYTTASSCGGGQSLLTNVRQYGSNATVSSVGAVSGGTSLPAATYGWSQPGSLGPQTYLRSQSYEYAGDGGVRKTLADINGDGRVDYCYQRDGYKEIRCMLGTATGLGPESLWATFSYSINNNIWGLADFNGDGKADFFYRADRSGLRYLYVSLSTGTAFGTSTYWGAHTYDIGGDYTQWHVIDVNSDGKADFVYEQATTGNPKYYRALRANAAGTGFSSEIALFTQTYDAKGNDEDNQQWFADVNGDGCLDRVYQRDASTELRVLLSNWCTGGATFGAETVWGSRLLEGSTWAQMADLNGDGRADHVYQSSADRQVRVMLSAGKSAFLSETTWGTASYTVFEVALRWFTDVDGDGLSDFVYQRSGSDTEFRIMKSTGVALKPDVLFMTRSWDAVGSDALNATWFADVTGDGRADHLYRRATTKSLYLFASQGSMGPLMTSVGNGLGGTTTLTYAPSSTWVATYLPAGIVFPTIQAVSVADGRGDTQATTYTYEGALWLDSSKEFLGFRKATTTQSSTGAYSETYYWQREGTIAKPEVIYKRKANGSILSFEKMNFTENTTAPFTSLATQMWAYECNGNGVVDANNNYVSGCKRVYTGYSWDQYGNMTREEQWGNYDLTGDERTVVRSFAPNTSAYIVGLPAYEEIRAGIGTSGTLLRRGKFYHDGATSEATAPTKGEITKRNLWNSQTGGYVVTSYAYDSYGNVTKVTDPWGSTQTTTYDSSYHTFPVTTTNLVGHTSSRQYNYVLGRETSSTDPNGYVTSASYDTLGRATLVTTPDGAQSKVEHLSYGVVSSQKVRRSQRHPNGTWAGVDTYFDGAGRIYKTVDVLSTIASDTIYGASGRPWKKSRPYHSGSGVATQWDVYTYDELGRDVGFASADGTSATVTYDDWRKTVTDHLGKATTSYFDAYGRVTYVYQSGGGKSAATVYRYDHLGRRTSMQGTASAQTALAYGSLGGPLQRSDPDQGLWKFEYDANGRITAEVDARNYRVTVAYDTLGRLTKRTYPDGTSETYYFDEAGYGASKGRATRAVTSAGVTQRSYYDSMGRVTRSDSVIDAATYTVKREYDTAGRLASLTYPDNEVVTYSYGTSGTQNGRLTAVGSKVTGITYSNLGMVAGMTYGNGVTSTYGYDAFNAVTSLQFGALATISYGYDVFRRMTSVTPTSQLPLGKWTYGYDTWGRLAQATNTGDSTKSQSFLYDNYGRMTSQTGVGSYTYGSSAHVHAPTVIGGQTYAYDANGNLTSGGGRTLTYNYGHKVASIVSGGQTTTFVYDAVGNRVKKVGPSGTVVYVEGLYEKRGTAVTKYYLALGQRVAKSDANGVSYLHNDHLGSTRLVSDASGAQVKRYDYSPFGSVIGESGTRPESHRFTGQEADDETGLLFYQSRYYDPRTALFLQVDSRIPDVLNPADQDPYRYCYNNPVSFTDPSGHAPVVAVFALVAAYMAAHTAVAVACFVIGTALSFTKNPYLATIGMVLAGVASIGMSGPLLGLKAAHAAKFVGSGYSMMVAATVALATSPISPLDATVKKVIGWAYTAWGVATAVSELGKGAKAAGEKVTPALDDPPVTADPRGSYVGVVEKDGVYEVSMFHGQEALKQAPADYLAALTEQQKAYIKKVPVWKDARPGSYETLGMYMTEKMPVGAKFTLAEFNPGKAGAIFARGEIVEVAGQKAVHYSWTKGFFPSWGGSIKVAKDTFIPNTAGIAPFKWY